MRRVGILMVSLLVLVISCNYPRSTAPVTQAAILDPVATPTSLVKSTVTAGVKPTVKPTQGPTVTWTGGTFQVETKNLIIDYPDFVDRADAQKHADTLQKAYDIFRGIFAFDDEVPFNGQKATVEWNLRVSYSSTSHNHIFMGSTALKIMMQGFVNPPDDTVIHEMAHVFELAQLDAERYYIFTIVTGIEESFTEYLECHPQIYPLWDRGSPTKAACDLVLYDIGDKGPETTLAYYESKKVDPYTLDWGTHPPGASGEVYFRQMLTRISDKNGWDIWEKYFTATKDSGGSPAAKDVYLNESIMKKGADMRDPPVKKLFSEFVSDLGKAIGQDLNPMFRGWRFDL